MSRSTADYVTMLEQLKIPKEDVKSAAELLTLVPEIEAFFCDPSIAVEKKHAAAEKLFPTSVRDLIRLLCDNQDMRPVPGDRRTVSGKTPGRRRQFPAGDADVCYRTGGSGQGRDFWPVYRSGIRAEPLFFLSEKMPPSSAVSGCRWTERNTTGVMKESCRH